MAEKLNSSNSPGGHCSNSPFESRSSHSLQTHSGSTTSSSESVPSKTKTSLCPGPSSFSDADFLSADASVPFVPLSCPNGHGMNYVLKVSVYNKDSVMCDSCQKNNLETGDFYWHCEVCDYDLCKKCGDRHVFSQIGAKMGRHGRRSDISELVPVENDAICRYFVDNGGFGSADGLAGKLEVYDKVFPCEEEDTRQSLDPYLV